MYNFDNAIDRSGTNSEKWAKDTIKEVCGNENAKPFWVADMDLPTSDAIKKAMCEAASFGVIGYPHDAKTLISAFTSFVKERHGWDVDPNKVLYTQGLLHGIAISLQAFSEKGDNILIPTPTYRPFNVMVERNERIIIPHKLGYKDGSFFLDREQYKKDSERAKIILFCSPHNPSGLVFSKEDLLFVLNLAKERDQIVFCDEIHADLVHPSVKHYPIGMVNEEVGAKCITFMAPSKTFNVAGEHFGISIFSDITMADKVKKAQEALWLTSPGYFALEIGKAAYTSSMDHNRELCAYLEQNKNFIATYLKENIPNLTLTNGDASFVCFIDCSAIYDIVKAKGFSDMSHFFGEYASLCFNDGAWFGDDYKSFIRFNYGTSLSEVKKALVAMKDAINTLKQEVQMDEDTKKQSKKLSSLPKDFIHNITHWFKKNSR